MTKWRQIVTKSLQNLSVLSKIRILVTIYKKKQLEVTSKHVTNHNIKKIKTNHNIQKIVTNRNKMKHTQNHYIYIYILFIHT